MVGTTHVTWHTGIDMVPVVKAMAIERGKVTDVGYNSVEGNYIVFNMKTIQSHCTNI
ncbi:MAG: hypothetical protein HGB31_02880 [Erysipelotrichaceae bacterium]|nr:hypothetical protein [Erysipelotrichaceae bacterium]